MIQEPTTATPASVSETAHTHHLRRELGLSDLVFTQILFIVGLPWVGVAAKQGPAHVVLLAAGDRLLLPAVGRRGHLPQSADAARGRPVPVGEARLQRTRRVPGRVEPVAVRDPQHVGDRPPGDAVLSATCSGRRASGSPRNGGSRRVVSAVIFVGAR